jgi:hypothetical protein
VRLQLTFDTAEAHKRLAALGKRGPLVVVRALNRAAGSARTAVGREIARDMGLKVGDVRERIKITNATPERMTATLYASSKPLPLIDFKATGPEPSRGRGRGVSAVIKGTRQRYPNAFIARMPSGHRGVFARKGKGRLPIRELFGVSIAFVFRKFEHVAIARAREQLAKNLAHELSFEMSRG